LLRIEELEPVFLVPKSILGLLNRRLLFDVCGAAPSRLATRPVNVLAPRPQIIEDALNELAYSQDPGLVRALRFLAPPGYQAIVELCSESGRSKRRNASAESWSPEDDEVRIYFERIDGEEPAPRLSRVPRAFAGRAAEEEEAAVEVTSPADMDARVKEICSALAEAERGGHAFIALKWFRDSFLPR
jgi:hypothetical protein